MRNTQILQKVAKKFIHNGLEILIEHPEEVFCRGTGDYALRFFLNIPDRNFGDWVYIHRSQCGLKEFPNIHVDINRAIIKYPREAFKRNVISLLPKEFLKNK